MERAMLIAKLLESVPKSVRARWRAFDDPEPRNSSECLATEAVGPTTVVVVSYHIDPFSGQWADSKHVTTVSASLSETLQIIR